MLHQVFTEPIVDRASAVEETRPRAPLSCGAFGLYVLMPSHPDPIQAPKAIVRAFRAGALTGLVSFWVEFALSLALLARTSGPLSDRRAT